MPDPLHGPLYDMRGLGFAAGEAATGAAANIDMALAALTVSRGLPRDAPFLIFAGGRMAGWIAHAIEQALRRNGARSASGLEASRPCR